VVLSRHLPGDLWKIAKTTALPDEIRSEQLQRTREQSLNFRPVGQFGFNNSDNVGTQMTFTKI
jgi:hypothetical protein